MSLPSGHVAASWASFAIVGAAVVAAIALRCWIFVSPLGRVDSDEGIIGLMALAIRDGSRVYIAWGNNYGGTLQPAFAALLLGLFGSSALVLKLAGVAFTVVSCVLCWRVARYVLDEDRARFAGALFLVYPAFDVWWSTKAGYYAAAVTCTLAVVLLALRVDAQAARASPRKLDVAALGFFTGLAWWTTPQCGFVVLPILVWLAVRRFRQWRAAWPFVPAALVGAAPWIKWNLANDWASLDIPPVTHPTTYLERLGRFFADTFPQMLGFRVPYERSWVLWGGGRFLYMLALVALVVGAVGLLRHPERRRRYLPVLVIAGAYPFLSAWPWTSWYYLSPRYLTQLAPFAALVVAAVCTTVFRRFIALSLAVMLAAGTIASLEDAGRHGFNDVVGPELTSLIEFLDEHDIDYIFSDYWISYALTFETERRILATPVDFVREPTIDLLVAGASPSTYVLHKGGPRDQAVTASLNQMGVGFQRHEVDDFAVFLLDRNMKQYDFPPGFWAAYSY